jgi:hypothetical protein
MSASERRDYIRGLQMFHPRETVNAIIKCINDDYKFFKPPEWKEAQIRAKKNHEYEENKEKEKREWEERFNSLRTSSDALNKIMGF